MGIPKLGDYNVPFAGLVSWGNFSIETCMIVFGSDSTLSPNDRITLDLSYDKSCEWQQLVFKKGESLSSNRSL